AGERAGFDRITFRPRMMVPTLDLDLGVRLVGATHFAPLIVGPVADQRRFHTDGELATLRGAAAARTAMIVSSRSSVPLAQIPKPDLPFWFIRLLRWRCAAPDRRGAGARMRGDVHQRGSREDARVAPDRSHPTGFDDAGGDQGSDVAGRCGAGDRC